MWNSGLRCLNTFIKQLHTSAAKNAIEIRMPALSPTMTDGTIISWAKVEGDQVSPGDVLCEIQTDKAVLPLEVDEEGILAKILAPANSTDVKIGTLIAMIAEEGEDWKTVAAQQQPVSPSSSEKQTVSEPVAEFSGIRHLSATPSLVGPAVRGLLELYGINPSDIKGSGPKDLILKGDVLKYVKERGLKPVELKAHQESPTKEKRAPPPMPTSFTMATAVKSEAENQAKAQREKAPPAAKNIAVSEFEDVELTNIRKVIARRLTESKGGIPHAYGVIDCPIDSVLQLRKSLKRDGVNVSVNDFIIKAVACALEAVPEVNVTLVGGEVKHNASVDISVAVATDTGLITPIVKGASGLGLQEISEIVKELATRARANKLKPHEFQGGSFSISNLGMYGISEFSAIINPHSVPF